MSDAMGPNTEIDLSTLHQAILNAIAAQFPSVNTVEDYRDDRRSLPLPAILVELSDLEADPESDPGTEQLAVTARFEARVIIGFRTANAEREIRKLAGSLAAFVHQQRWGQPVEGAQVLTVTPDTFDPDLDQYVVWRVEWQQVIYLGQSVWTNDGEIPETVLFSYEPETGVPNEDKYIVLDQGAFLGDALE